MDFLKQWLYPDVGKWDYIRIDAKDIAPPQPAPKAPKPLEIPGVIILIDETYRLGPNGERELI